MKPLDIALLVFFTLGFGFMSWASLKTGEFHFRGRLAASRQVSPLIFWTLWALYTSIAVGGLALIISVLRDTAFR